MPPHILTLCGIGQNGAQVEKAAKPDVPYSYCDISDTRMPPPPPMGPTLRNAGTSITMGMTPSWNAPWRPRKKLCHEEEFIKVTETLKSTPEFLLFSQMGARPPTSTPIGIRANMFCECIFLQHFATFAFVCPPVMAPNTVGTPTQSGRTRPAKDDCTGAYVEHARP